MALSITTYETNFKPSHWLSQLHSIKYRGSHVFGIICDFLDEQSLCRLCGCSKEFNYVASSEYIWKHRCLSRWPELKMATKLEEDPFPVYKSCYKRKAMEEGTSMQDLMKIFGHCDWYSCPNGHLYTIGECRMAVMMSKCPECGEAIGGRFHRHLDTNLRIGAVRASHNPLRSSQDNTEEIKFDEVSNVVHSTSNTGFAKRGRNEEEPQRINGWGQCGGFGKNGGLGYYYSDDPMVPNPERVHNLGTITENETTNWTKILERFGEMEEAPEYIVCPLSLDVFVDPVVTPNGKIYERQFIEDWLQEHDTDPMDANIKLEVTQLEPEEDVKKAARLWKESRSKSND